MLVEAATVDQIRQTDDGGWIVIPAEAGTVAGDIRKLDAGLKVRFSKTSKHWAIFHEHHPDCPHNGTAGPGSTYLVMTAQAHQGIGGIWTGLDQRVVKRLEQINPFGRAGYDYAAELEKSHHDAQKRQKHEFAERVGEAAERAAHSIRRELSLGSYKGRIHVPREV